MACSVQVSHPTAPSELLGLSFWGTGVESGGHADNAVQGLYQCILVRFCYGIADLGAEGLHLCTFSEIKDALLS